MRIQDALPGRFRPGCQRATLVASLLFGVASVAATERSLEVTAGFDYSTGDYGTSSSTEIVYVPLTLEAELEAERGSWTVRTTVPYIRITSEGGTVQGPNGPIEAVAGTENGLGDVLARGSYTLSSSGGWRPWVELAGLVKFPTASRARGLGTGKFDFGLETELTWVTGRLTPFVSGGYLFLGSAPGLALDNVFTASVGAQYRVLDRPTSDAVSRRSVNVGLLFDYREAASATTGPRMELLPFGSFSLPPHWDVGIHAVAGLADGSPDAGAGLEIAYTL
jgi:hypothetical protein